MNNIVATQFGASLAMLRNAIEQCPTDLWDDSESYRCATWRIAYHALFYVHLYIMPTAQDFTPWAHHHEDYEALGPKPWAPDEPLKIGAPYTKDQVLAYHDFVSETIARILPTLDLTSDQSGFDWLPFGKLELQFYSIRHLQQHTGEICERIFVAADKEVGWVGQQALSVAAEDNASD